MHKTQQILKNLSNKLRKMIFHVFMESMTRLDMRR